MRKAKKPSIVYFMKPTGLDGPIKIGFSRCPEERLLTFSYWSPFPLELIGCISGTIQDEQFLHDCFCDIHLHHEWFSFSRALRAAIDGVILHGMGFARSTMIPRGRLSSRCRTPEMKARTSAAGKKAWRAKRKTGIPRAKIRPDLYV